MIKKIYKIATRQSPLALWQANYIRGLLQKIWPNLEFELLPMKTTGDKFLGNPLNEIGGKGLFIKELEDSLLNHKASIAVHSMKDVPAFLPDPFTLGAICKRESPFDVLLSLNFKDLTSLPPKARIGTVSLRRKNQLLAIRSDLTILPLRGNIQTRIDKMQDGEFDAIILAHAGLLRLNLEHNIREIFTQDRMLPACGQGALGIECLKDDEEIKKIIAPLNDSKTSKCVQTERHVNTLLDGSCRSPLAVYCNFISNSKINLQARLVSDDGKIQIDSSVIGNSKNNFFLAETCASELIQKGAKDFL